MTTTTATLNPMLTPAGVRQAQATKHVGMILALVSFTMMFAGLFYSYGLLRIRSVAWPPPGVPEPPLLIPSIITVMMFASSVALEQGRKALDVGRIPAFHRFTMGAIILGSLFIGLQAQVWVQMWEAGLTLVVGPYASLFYFLTLFHALHVLAGLGILVRLYLVIPRAGSVVPGRSTAQLASMFWHFVGVVWLVIFSLVYVF
jgi:cytochrome c oxidase subunit 3